MFQKIMVAVDGSGCSLKATRAAGELADRFGSTITLLHVLHTVPGVIAAPVVAGMVVPDQVTIEAVEAGARDILQCARECLSLPDERVNTQFVPGHPAETICRTAAELHADLIVVGSRGLSEIRAFFLGSVSDRVSHHAPCPVLIIR